MNRITNRLLPELSKHFTVIAPDLRGMGESDKPGRGYDNKTMAAEFGSVSFLASHSRVVALHVTEVVIRGSGHWIVQEKAEQVQKALLDFFL